MAPDERMVKPPSPGFSSVSHFCYLVHIIPFGIYKAVFNTANNGQFGCIALCFSPHLLTPQQPSGFRVGSGMISSFIFSSGIIADPLILGHTTFLPPSPEQSSGCLAFPGFERPSFAVTTKLSSVFSKPTLAHLYHRTGPKSLSR